MLAYVFGYRLEWTPIGGYCSVFTPSETCGGLVLWAYHLLLPWLAFAAVFAAVYDRMIRASVLEVVDSDHTGWTLGSPSAARSSSSGHSACRGSAAC